MTAKPRAAKAKAPTAPTVPKTRWQPEDTRILCKYCGCSAGKHRGNDGKCPQTHGWGKAAADPMSDWSLEGPALDAALAAYWSANKTSYARMT